jgi:hypothetical protein
MKWRNIALLSVLYLSCTGLYAQERIKSDSLKFDKDSMKAIFDDGLVSPDAVGYSFDYNENTGSDPITEIPKDQKIEFKLHKPFYIPPYYTDSSPRFYGDYTTGGQIFPNIYGSGMQETLPGLGRLNQASLFYRYDLNDYFSIQAGMNAVKYNFPMSVGQSLGTFGSITYHPTDRLRISAFGSYSPDSRYGFNRNTYGAAVGYDFTDRFGMEVGVQRYYDPQRGWQTIPIVTPYYKFNKFDLGIDVGGILYEILRSVVIDKRGGSPVIMPPGR